VIEQLDFFLDVWDGDAADGSAQPKKRLALREEIRRLQDTLAARVRQEE
jgi:hypothetical protein